MSFPNGDLSMEAVALDNTQQKHFCLWAKRAEERETMRAADRRMLVSLPLLNC